jgi:hypothetical protein
LFSRETPTFGIRFRAFENEDASYFSGRIAEARPEERRSVTLNGNCRQWLGGFRNRHNYREKPTSDE